MVRRSTAAAPFVPELENEDIVPGEFRIILRTDAVPSELNPRGVFDHDSLAELAETMRPPVGIIEPLVVRPFGAADATTFEIIAGERRWRAAALAGLLEIPVMIKHLTDRQVIDVMMVENEQREDINPLEKAAVYRQAIGFGRTDADVAHRIGRDIRYVRDTMRLLDLIPEAQALLLRGKLPKSHAIELSRLLPPQQKDAINPNNYDAAFSPNNERLIAFEDPAAGDARKAEKADPYAELKPRSLGEFKTWINDHCRLQPLAAVAQDIFPEAAETFEKEEKVVKITYNHHVHPDAKEGAERTYSVRSWKRADGIKSRTCDRSCAGIVVVGPGRGNAFRVCVDKACKTHWPPAKKSRASSSAAAQETRRNNEIERDRKRREAEAARRKSWMAAKPAILEAFGARLENATLPQLIAYITRDARGQAAGVKRFPGKANDDRLRAYVFGEMSQAFAYDYHAENNSTRVAKPWGLKLGPIVAKATKKPAKKR